MANANLRLSLIKDIKEVNFILRRYECINAAKETNLSNNLIPKKIHKIAVTVDNKNKPKQLKIQNINIIIHVDIPLQSILKI